MKTGEHTVEASRKGCGAEAVVGSPPWNEAERLEALARYGILDTPRGREFDDVLRLAANVFEAPIAVVNLIAEGRQWFKAELGIGADELPLDVSICAHAILQPGIFVVPDTTQDPRFASNPLVHGLASQLDGGLAISSTPGDGTTIDLWLPVSLVGAKDDAQTPGSAAKPTSRGTALLVDDEELVRMSTADMLMDLGYNVVEACSAEEALKLVSEGLHPDVLVTDHLMPGLTGVELARDLQARQPELPVLIVSGYAEAEGIAPEIARLTKPFRNSELAESLSGLTGNVEPKS